MAEIQKDFPATYTCTEDLASYCPDFGRLSPDQWGKNGKAESSDKGGHNYNPPANPPATPAQPDTPPQPTSLPPPSVVEQPAPANPEDSSEGYTDYFTWDYYGGLDYYADDEGSGIDSLHSKKKDYQKDQPKDNQQCFRKNYAAFSAPCLNAIAEQWAAEQTAKGVKNISAPTADEAYDMMSPPVQNTPEWKKMSRALFYIALGFFACTLITCLCCCCRRCKKRRAARIVPNDQHVDLTTLPEAVVVPMAAPARYVPSAIPVRPQTSSYVPYTGQGLAAYVPLAQPVHV